MNRLAQPVISVAREIWFACEFGQFVDGAPPQGPAQLHEQGSGHALDLKQAWDQGVEQRIAGQEAPWTRCRQPPAIPIPR